MEIEPVGPNGLDNYRRGIEEAARLAGKARADATVRAYQGDWRRWVAWCRVNAVDPDAATTADVAAWLGHLAGSTTGRGTLPKPATLARAASALRAVYDRMGGVNPARAVAIADVVNGHKRDAAARGVTVKRARAVTPSEILSMVQLYQGDRPSDLRNRALLLVGFATAMRRSELAAMHVDHVRQVTEGLVVHVPISKTDQAGNGADIPVAYAPDPALCPVRAWQAWTTALGRDNGPAWPSVSKTGHLRPTGTLTDRGIADVIARAADHAGLTGVSPHSLRAGFVTAAALNRATLTEIQAVTRHGSTDVLIGYVRRANPHEGSAASRLWARG